MSDHPSRHGTGTDPDPDPGVSGLSYVKSRDVPHLDRLTDSDERLRRSLAAMDPEQRADWEGRIRRSEAFDRAAFSAHRSTWLAAITLGWSDFSDPGWHEDKAFTAAVTERTRPAATSVLSFRGMQFELPVPTGDHVTQGCTATTKRPGLALAQRRATRRDLSMVGQRLLAIWGPGGRDASGMSAFPDDEPTIHLPGATLRPVGREDVVGVQVTAYVEVVDSRADDDLDGVWTAVHEAMTPRRLAVPDGLAREPNPYFDGELA